MSILARHHFRFVARRVAVALLALLLGGALTDAGAEKRVALVIGNSSYRTVAALANPRNDARDIASALQRLGFDTTVGLDADRAQMEKAIEEFAIKVEGADVAVFYYAGHGMQYRGVNYLLPTDVDLQNAAGLRRLTKLNDVVADVKKAKALRILVLDACRDNPLADILEQQSSGQSVVATRSVGLAKLTRTVQQTETPTAETTRGGDIVIYAAEAGRTASDGTGRNSPFTSALLRNIETEGQEVVGLIRRVAVSVQQETGGAQRPELLLSVPFEFFFKPGAATAPPTVQIILPKAKPHEVGAIEAQIQSIVDAAPVETKEQVRREVMALLSDIAARSNLQLDQIDTELPQAYARLIRMRQEIAQFRNLMENEPEIAPFVEIAAAAVSSGRRPDLAAADEALARAQARYDETVRVRTDALARSRSNRAALLEQRGHIAETESRANEAAEFYLSAARDTPEIEPAAAGRRFAMAGAALFVHGSNFFANDKLRAAIQVLESQALKRFEQAAAESGDPEKILAASAALVLAQIGDAQTRLGGRLPGIEGVQMMIDARASYAAALKRVQVAEFPGLAMDVLDRRAQRDVEFGRRIAKDRGRGHFSEAVKTTRLILSIQTGKPAYADQLGRTRNNLANALKELSKRTEGSEGDAQIDEAIALFEQSLDALTKQNDRGNALIARLNLAHALGLRAERREGMSGIADIERAQGLFTSIAAELQRNANPRLLAVLQRHQAELLRLEGERQADRVQGFQDLKTAFETYQKVLPVTSKETAPNDWAMLCAEMAYTLVAALPLMEDGARRTSGKNAASLFGLARPYLVAGGFGQDIERLDVALTTARRAAGEL